MLANVELWFYCEGGASCSDETEYWLRKVFIAQIDRVSYLYLMLLLCCNFCVPNQFVSIVRYIFFVFAASESAKLFSNKQCISTIFDIIEGLHWLTGMVQQNIGFDSLQQRKKFAVRVFNSSVGSALGHDSLLTQKTAINALKSSSQHNM